MVFRLCFGRTHRCIHGVTETADNYKFNKYITARVLISITFFYDEQKSYSY